MRVAMCNRKNYDNPLGGDGVQMLKTREYLLRQYNIDVTIVTDANRLDSTYDLIHVFNYLSYKVTHKFISKAKMLNIPIVTSSIYWDYSYASSDIFYKIINRYPSSISWNLVLLNRRFLKLTSKLFSKPTGLSWRFKKNARYFFNSSEKILPNSIEEARLLINFLGLEKKSIEKCEVVVNGTDYNLGKSVFTEKSFLEKYNLPNDYILQVGRIEFAKNQLNLVSSLMSKPEIPIVFVGKIANVSYYKKLRKISSLRGNVYFINEVPHEEINSFYIYARVHVLLSLRESPGLVNIEALKNDCPIVISDNRFMPVDTYFKGNEYVVDPLNLKEIKRVVLKAYKKREVCQFDYKYFSWENAANQTYKAYKSILS